VGPDFADYRAWLEGHGVDCDHLLASPDRHTARFICTTDSTHAQIASFYPGAMSQARGIALAPVAEAVGGLDLVVVAPNDPDAMIRHTEECRERGYRFVADPSQQLAFADGEMVRQLVDGADVLMSNEYEAALTEQKTGWTADQILQRTGIRVVTLGPEGVRIERAGEPTIQVPAIGDAEAIEPTGVGDAFRAGFLAAWDAGLDLTRAAQVGCTLAGYVVETVGTQEYTFTTQGFLDRLAASYGPSAAAEVRPLLPAESVLENG
jgi:adenosine kinase